MTPTSEAVTLKSALTSATLQHSANAVRLYFPSQPLANAAHEALQRFMQSSAPKASPAPLEGLVEAAQALVAKLDVVHADDAYQNVWFTSHMRNGPYTGPTYDTELTALRKALSRAQSGEQQV